MGKDSAKAKARRAAVVDILEDVADRAARIYGRPDDDWLGQQADRVVAALAKLEG